MKENDKSQTVTKATEDKKKKNPLIAKINEDTGKMLLESLLPKILPFIESAEEKINEYLGDNDKMIMIFRIKGKTKVLITNNEKGNYLIENDFENKSNFKMKVDQDAVENVFDVKEFAQKLLAGDFNLKN